jgi:hypothetical protein
VRAAGGVVDAGQGAEQGLELGEGGGLARLGAEPVLHGLLEPPGLALGLGVARLAVLLPDPRRRSLCSRPLRPPRPPDRRVLKTVPYRSGLRPGRRARRSRRGRCSARQRR